MLSRPLIAVRGRLILAWLLLPAAACDGTFGFPSDDASFGDSGGVGAVGGGAGSGGTGGNAGVGGDAGVIDPADAALSDAALDVGASSDAMISDASFEDAGTDAAVADAGMPPQPTFEALFDPALLPTFEITLSQAAIDALGANPDVYQSGTLRYGTIVLNNVGVRLKGRASFQGFDQKPALKIKVNEFVSGQRFFGLKRITLNNMIQDPSMVRERLAYAVFREAGVPAPLCNHARVYINGEYYGLYANVQTLDEVFLASHWSPSPGNLYDISNDTYHIDFERERATVFNPRPPKQETKFVLETNTTLNDTSDLTAVIDAVSSSMASSSAGYLAGVDAVLDVDEVLADGAVQAVISDWDGYFGSQNNYKAYHELSRDRFILFPWGVDQTFGIQDNNYNKLNYNIDHSNSGRTRSYFYGRCRQNTACQARYIAQVRLALAAFERLDLEAEMDTILMQIDASITEDTRRPYSNATHTTGVANLRDFLRRRAAVVRSQLP